MINIESLIRACGRVGVSHLKYKELEVTFHDSGSSRKETEPPKNIETITSSASQPEKTELTPEQRKVLQEWEDLNLAVDDPVAYENSQINEDIENERSEDWRSEQNVHGRGGSGS